MFETTVPEEIIIVKCLSGKRKHKKKPVEPDGDSDEEAQQLIDEAENERLNETVATAGMRSVVNMSMYHPFIMQFGLFAYCEWLNWHRVQGTVIVTSVVYSSFNYIQCLELTATDNSHSLNMCSCPPLDLIL